MVPYVIGFLLLLCLVAIYASYENSFIKKYLFSKPDSWKLIVTDTSFVLSYEPKSQTFLVAQKDLKQFRWTIPAEVCYATSWIDRLFLTYYTKKYLIEKARRHLLEGYLCNTILQG